MKIRFRDLIVFENDDFAAINKPAGIASLHERVADGHSIIEITKQFNSDWQLCHRLDKETSGVLLLSKHAAAYTHAAKLFEKRKIRKIYHAVCTGFHQFEDRKVNLPLTTTRSGKSGVNSLKGKESITVFNTLERFEHYTLVQAEPLTGRLHQIRIHLATQNAPITSDLSYGAKMPLLSEIKSKFYLSKFAEEKPMINRVALHAYSLSFMGMEEKELTITAEYPTDFAVLLKQLRKYDASKY